MTANIYQIKSLPSGSGTFWHAVRKPIRCFDPVADIENLEIGIPHLNIDSSHLSSFFAVFTNDWVNSGSAAFVPSIYPMTFVYPVMLRAVSISSITLPMMLSMVSIKSRIYCYQTIRPDWTFSIQAGFKEVRSTLKGIELDFILNLKTGSETVWQNTNTLFFRGMRLKNQSCEGGFMLAPVESVSNELVLVINSKQGKHFCKLMGDSNAIHTNRFVAKLMGYDNAFSEPYQALGQLLMKEDWLSMSSAPGKWYFEFKGPLYYDERITAKYKNENDKLRFDLYSGENQRPGILGFFESIDTKY